MPKYAILSDIHSNIHALNEVITHAQNHGISKFICLGDSIGYGAFPSECIAKLQKIDANVIAGNHDVSAFNQKEFQYLNNQAKQAMTWTINKLSPDEMAWLANLPLKLELDNATFIHASPQNPEAFHYVIDLRDAVLQFDYFATDFCFYGHSHLPVIFQEDLGEVRELEVTEHHRKSGQRLLINVGSVGQPRDNDKRACWCLYDSDSNYICLQRTDYDYTSAAKAILDSGLPVFLGERILRGV